LASKVLIGSSTLLETASNDVLIVAEGGGPVIVNGQHLANV